MIDPTTIDEVRRQLRRNLESALSRRISPNDHPCSARWSLHDILFSLEEALAELGPGSGAVPALTYSPPMVQIRTSRGRFGRRIR